MSTVLPVLLLLLVTVLGGCFAGTEARLTASDDDDQCERRYLHGVDADKLPTADMYEGVYYKTKEENNNRPVYMHETRKIFVYYDGEHRWVFEQTYTSNGKLRKEDIAINAWSYFDQFKHGFVLAGGAEMKFECAPESYHQCSTEAYKFEDAHFSVPEEQVFKLVEGKVKNNRPVYATNNDLELSYSSEDAAWQVTRNSVPFLLAQDYALNPAYIRANWEELIEGQWEKRQGHRGGLHLACQSELNDSSSCNATDPCLNKGLCHVYEQHKYCLCQQGEGYTGATCSQKLAACPAPPAVPGSMGVYGSSEKYWLGDTATLKCRHGLPKSFVRITCSRDADDKVTWPDDATCLRRPPINHEPVQQARKDEAENVVCAECGPDVKWLTVVAVLCAIIAVLFVCSTWVVCRARATCQHKCGQNSQPENAIPLVVIEERVRQEDDARE